MHELLIVFTSYELPEGVVTVINIERYECNVQNNGIVAAGRVTFNTNKPLLQKPFSRLSTFHYISILHTLIILQKNTKTIENKNK